MKNIIQAILIIFLILIFAGLAVGSESKSGEEINWQVISSGGNINGTSTNYLLSGTVSQTATGEGTSTNYGLHHGFWQEFGGGGGGCCDVPGDANDNGSVNILDITFLIAYLYKGGPAPNCTDKGDANGNNSTNILDITYLIAYLYKGGPAPICGTTGS